MSLCQSLLLLLAAAQQPTTSMEEILTSVRTNTGQFVQSLPDFICDEQVVSKASRHGKPVGVEAESHFVGLQKKSGFMVFTEKREVLILNGKPARHGASLQGPLLFGGGFSSILNSTFGPDSDKNHTYRLAGDTQLDGRPALLIEFATRRGQTDLRFVFDGRPYLENDTGRAWVDPATLHVLRIERHYLNVPWGQTPMVAVVDYAWVSIDGKPFWMPSSVRVTQSAGAGIRDASYVAQYANYRKFEASSAIIY